LWFGEESVVEPDLGGERMGGAEPVDRALDLVLVGARRARFRVGHDPGAHRDDPAVGILVAAGALDHEAVAQADAVAGEESPETLGRDFLEVLAFDPKFAGEGQGSFTAFG